MTPLPITRMIPYKHGVGYFERCARLTGERVVLSFRVEEMNDVLKSLTPIDWGAGQVRGVEYATPQTRAERLAGCSVQLGAESSLQDLLASLRGRRVELHLDQNETLAGRLVGLDGAPTEQPTSTALVSLLADDASQVRTVPLGRVQGVEILDAQGAADLRFFLQTSLSSEQYNQVIIHFTPGKHDLSVGNIAPAPTWRVSYRLVAATTEGREAQALLLGWGIFDNRLEEDLADVQVLLVAGMPISFVYDLYTPFMPARPGAAESAQLEEVLALWSEIAKQEQHLAEIADERALLYKAQEQYRANLQSLATTGKEGTLRTSYVDRLQASEDQLQVLAEREAQIKAAIAALQTRVDDKLRVEKP